MGALMRPEFLLLVVIGFMLFGAKRLPEMGSAIGKTIKEFQRSMKDEHQVTTTETPTISAPAQPQVTTATPAATLAAPTTASAAETPVQSSAQ